jgi:hypothetical protein
MYEPSILWEGNAVLYKAKKTTTGAQILSGKPPEQLVVVIDSSAISALLFTRVSTANPPKDAAPPSREMAYSLTDAASRYVQLHPLSVPASHVRNLSVPAYRLVAQDVMFYRAKHLYVHDVWILSLYTY